MSIEEDVDALDSVMQRAREREKRKAERREALRLLRLLPQGEGSGLDADTVDGLHAREILSKIPVVAGGGGSGGGGSGMVHHGNEYHTKTFIEGADVPANETDPNVDDTLKGVTKTQVQDHTPKEHGNEKHSATFEDQANKGAANGYASLDGSTKVPAAQMPTAKVYTTLSFAVVGTLSVDTDVAPTIVAPCALTIIKAKVVVKTAPTGSSILVDVNKAGTTIFTTQANRPEIAVGETQDDSGTPDVTTLAEGDKVTIDIDQIGSGTAGADLTVELVCTQNVVFS